MRLIVTSCALAMTTGGGIAMADDLTGTDDHTGVSKPLDTSPTQSPTQDRLQVQDQTDTTDPMQTTAAGEDRDDTEQQVREAVTVVKQMEEDGELAAVMADAHGIFIVPDYGRAALVVGGRGGEGVLLVKTDGEWTGPAFYDFGGISAGLQAGVEAGSIAMVLNSQQAVDSFTQDNNWSLNAEAGLTIANWSGKAQASAGKDVVMWSDTEGLFGDLAISISDINYDEEETAAYYDQQVNLADIVQGNVDDPNGSALKDALSGASS